MFKKQNNAREVQVNRIYEEMELHSPSSKEFGELCRRLDDVQKIKEREKRAFDWRAAAMVISALITGIFSTYQVRQIRKDELDPEEPKIHNSRAWSIFQKPR